MTFLAVCHVFLVLAILTVLISSGLFDTVETECGFDFYAENLTNWKAAVSVLLPSQSSPTVFPSLPVTASFEKWIKMPANTLVNIGYLLVGFIILKTWSTQKGKEITADQQYYASVFAWLSIVYGPIQFIRIVTQSHRSAVLDQWITLVFFSWAIIWYFRAYRDHLVKNQRLYTVMYLCSIASYLLTLFNKFGFDIALGIHITIAVVALVHIVMHFDNTLFNFVCIILACSGFIFLKLYDLELASVSIFSVLTGHFWSKVCDCLQIYYASKILLQVQYVKVKSQ